MHRRQGDQCASRNQAVAEYNRLIDVYSSLGYDIRVLPKVGVAERADWILASLADDVT
jgi:predicted ATPase